MKAKAKPDEWIGRTPRELKKEIGMQESEILHWDEFLYAMGYPLSAIEDMETVRKGKHFRKISEIRKHNRKVYLGRHNEKKQPKH